MTKRSSGVSGIADQTIYMSQGSTFSTNGHINNVTVAATANTTYYTAGAVSINTEKDNTYQNKADGAQSATDIRETSNLTFTVTSESTPALIQTAASPDKKYQQITLRQFIVNVEGTVDAGDVLSFDAGTSYYTGKTYTSTWGNNYYVDTDDNIADETKKIVPMTSVTGNLVVTDYKGNDGTTDFNSGVIINGYVSVSETITAQYTAGSNGADPTAASIKFTANKGIVYVTGSISMNVASIPGTGSSSAIYQGSIIVDGGNMTPKT